MATADPKHASQGAPAGCFRTTHWSLVARAGEPESEESTRALEWLCRAYWYPLFAYVRYRGYPLEEAEDLTQAFFAQLLSRNYLASADRERGRFRTFLLGSMNHFLANQWNRDRAQKRGGHCEFISLEQVDDPGGFVPDPAHHWTPERLYERRWAETVLANVLDRLRAEFDGTSVKRFEVLKSFLTDFRGSVSYQEAARLLGMTESAIKSAINRLRQRWRELMREEIAQTLQVVTEKEVDEEIRYLIEVLE